MENMFSKNVNIMGNILKTNGKHINKNFSVQCFRWLRGVFVYGVPNDVSCVKPFIIVNTVDRAEIFFF